MHQPETATATEVIGPLAAALTELSAAGWESLPAPTPTHPKQQLVLLAGPGGVLVIGTHKSTDAALADFTATVTSLLPVRLRRAVISDNGHDIRSLPQLAIELPACFDAADIREAAAALIDAARQPLTVSAVLERSRDAQPEPSRARVPSTWVAGVTAAVRRHAVMLVVVMCVLVVSVMVSNSAHEHAEGAAPGSAPHSSQSQSAHPAAPPRAN